MSSILAENPPQQAPPKPEDDTYAGPRSFNEYNRLRLQHGFIKYFMDGELVFAPIDQKSPSLRVLDSATGDGFWLADLAPTLSPSATLIGADIAPQHFLLKEELPNNVSLINHNIFDPWPVEYKASFDLVHQRFVLMACNNDNSVTAIKHLFDCVKPGGWIQLHDGDMDTIKEGPEHAAMMKFREVARVGWWMMGFNLSPGPKLTKWLEEAGAVDIEERLLEIKCGKSCPDKQQGENVSKMLIASLDNMMALTSVPGFPYSPDDVEKLKRDLPEELERFGNCYRTHVVWARKPF